MRRTRGIEIKTPDQLKAMRRAGLVVAAAHEAMQAAAVPGATTADLDAVARDVLARHGATSNFLNYGAAWGMTPYPATVCVSVNDEIVHGIPGERVLVEGDLVSVDFGAVVDGWHGDAARSFAVGEWTPERRHLSEVTFDSLWAGIGAARVGGRLGDISHAIEASIEGHEHEFGIVEEYTGHGIGSAMHQPPDVPNYGRPRRGPKLVAGMVLAIEPMVTWGPSAATVTLDDDWTVVTQDGSDACHWEHTVAFTAAGLWILTAPDGGEEMLTKLGVPFGPLSD